MKRTVQEIHSNWALGTYVSVHRENFNVTQVMKVTPPCHGLRCQTSGKRRGLNMRSASHLRSLLRCCGHVSFPATSLSSVPGGQHLPCARQPPASPLVGAVTSTARDLLKCGPGRKARCSLVELWHLSHFLFHFLHGSA